MEHIVECRVARFPHGTNLCEVVGGGNASVRREMGRTYPALSAPGHQTGSFKDLQVLRNCGLAHVEGLGMLGHTRVALRQMAKDGTPGAICEGVENAVE